ncbi:MAG: hypothetical protein K2X60_03380 [Xanthobacteraceae bacterium]|nr:hypothetical protein [Xanthobacteraceae bacterium]
MKGAAFNPEEITLLKSVLDDAVARLAPAERTSAAQALLAHKILTQAAKGERDPIRLRTSALLKCRDGGLPSPHECVDGGLLK